MEEEPVVCIDHPKAFGTKGSPPILPKTPTVTMKGTTNCTTLTPRLPRPPFIPRAVPLLLFGKKKLILPMEEAKFPSPKPHNIASITIVV